MQEEEHNEEDWGMDEEGDSSDSDEEIDMFEEPTFVNYFHEQDISIDDIACGHGHIVAFSEENGSVYTWGNSVQHCLGHGNQKDKYTNVPKQVNINGKVVGIAAGSFSTFALSKPKRERRRRRKN